MPAASSNINDQILTSGSYRAAFAQFLKIFYMNAMADAVHQFGQFGTIFSGTKQKVDGLVAVIHQLITVPTSGAMPYVEGGLLPRPNTSNGIQPEVRMIAETGRLRWTKEVEESSRSDKGSWARARATDLKGIRLSMGRKRERRCILGRADILGVLVSESVVSGQMVMVMEPMANRNSANPFASGNHYFYKNPGDQVMFIDGAAGYLGAPAYAVSSTTIDTAYNTYVTAVSDDSFAASPTVTINRAVDGGGTAQFTMAAGDYVTTYRNREDGTYGSATNALGFFNSPEGFYGFIGTSLYSAIYGLDKTLYPGMRGRHDTNSGVVRSYAESQMQAHLDTLVEQGNGAEPNVLIMNRATRREVVAEHAGDRRYQPVQSGPSGFGKLVHQGGDMTLDIKAEWQMLPGIVVGVNKGSMEMFQRTPLTTLPERWVPDTVQNEIVMYESFNNVCMNPNGNGALDDVEFSL